VSGLGDLLADPALAMTDDELADAVGALFGFHGSVSAHFDSERDQTVLLTDEFGERRVVKVSHPAADEARGELGVEAEALLGEREHPEVLDRHELEAGVHVGEAGVVEDVRRERQQTFRSG